MKAKNLYYVMALCAGAMMCNSASAQDVFVDDAVSVTEFTCDNTNHYFSNWRNNWFIEVSAGGNQPLVERGLSADQMKSLDAAKWTATYSVGFGRWVSPYIGFRFKGIGGSMHFDMPFENQTTGQGFIHMKSANLQLEMLWDMFNSINYNPNRVFSIIPFFGLGGGVTWDFKNKGNDWPPFLGSDNNAAAGETRHAKRVQWTLPVSAGLQFRFRLCKYVDFFAEARATFFGDNWNNVSTGSSIDALVSAMGGFNFNIGGRGWNKFNECEYVSQIAALNGQVNDLRSQLLACGQEVASLQSQLPCPEVVQKDCVNAPLMSTVRFMINSAKIMPTEEVNVYNMAEWLKANPNEKVMVVGYADKNTGTAEYNLKLSQRRAEAVAKSLTDDYGIAADRLTVKWDGSEIQPYSTNDWNRIVIFTQK